MHIEKAYWNNNNSPNVEWMCYHFLQSWLTGLVYFFDHNAEKDKGM